MTLTLILIYAIVAVAIPVTMTVLDGPDPDPAVFVFGCFFSIFWPIYAPFVLLWLCVKGLSAAVADKPGPLHGWFPTDDPDEYVRAGERWRAEMHARQMDDPGDWGGESEFQHDNES
jgi:hypothetical protein